MNDGRLIFTQVFDMVDRKQLQRCCTRYPARRASRGMSSRDHFLSMGFAQLTYRESLRDIEACLRGNRHLYAMGIRGNVTRTNLAYANEHRPWRVYADLAQVLVRKARRLYAQTEHVLGLKEMIYALDSSTIDLCLSLFPWARFIQSKAAIKLHTQMDLRGSIPVFMRVTDGRVHDVNFLDHIILEAGANYVMDRGYIDFARLYGIHRSQAFFVTRARKDMNFYVSRSNKVADNSPVFCDQLIRLNGRWAKNLYPERIRRIGYFDNDTARRLYFITNRFDLPAETIAAIYKSRWHIELFFKWIKQNLRIKAFYGLSTNAVKTQIWIAICVYLMIACLKKIHGIDENMGRILQVLSVNVFQKDPINQLLMKPNTTDGHRDHPNQLMLNGF